MAIGYRVASLPFRCSCSVSFANRQGLPPHTSPLPQHKNVFGEGEQMVGTLTQGGARVSCPSLALGYLLAPFQGSQRKQRRVRKDASNQANNDSHCRGNDENPNVIEV
jgi:hypothetical protein